MREVNRLRKENERLLWETTESFPNILKVSKEGIAKLINENMKLKECLRKAIVEQERLQAELDNPVHTGVCEVCHDNAVEENRILSERIQRLVEGVKSRDEIIKRLKEDGERLAYYCVRRNHFVQYTCVLCDAYADTIEEIQHDPDCDVLKHRQLMKELEDK